MINMEAVRSRRTAFANKSDRSQTTVRLLSDADTIFVAELSGITKGCHDHPHRIN
jgi:hypothetical protein